MIHVPNFDKKIYNYRPLVSIVLFMIAGIIFVYGIYIKSVLSIILSALMAVALVATLVVKIIKAKDLKLFKILTISVSFALASVITVAYFESANNLRSFSGEYFVTGEISERAYINDDYKLVLTLDNVEAVSFENLEKIQIAGKVRLYLSQDDCRSLEFMPGEIVKTTATLSRVKLINKDRTNFSLYNKGIKVMGFGTEGDLVKTPETNYNIFDRFKIKVKNTLNKYLSDEYSELGYTMLIGDKSGLDDEVRDIYSESGIAHLLAVSGLHVGFVVTLLSFILDLFKASNKFKFYFLSIGVFLYAFLCGFSVSVTRALIMTVVLLFSKMRDREYDSLSSISLAAIIILGINPLWLFDVGFQLSFCAVLGIVLLTPLFKSINQNFFKTRFANALNVCLSATIGTIPVLAITFGKVSIFSIVTNMIVVPVASIAFMIMFVSVILACIIPPLGVVSYIFELLMRFVTFVGRLTGSVNVTASPIITTIFTIVLLVTCMLYSNVFNMNKKQKIVYRSLFGGFSILLFVLLFVF